MTRSTILYLGVRGLGLYFLARTILLIPQVITAVRARDLLYGPDAAERLDQVFPLVGLGISSVMTCLGVFVIAAAVLLLMPIPSVTE